MLAIPCRSDPYPFSGTSMSVTLVANTMSESKVEDQRSSLMSPLSSRLRYIKSAFGESYWRIRIVTCIILWTVPVKFMEFQYCYYLNQLPFQWLAAVKKDPRVLLAVSRNVVPANAVSLVVSPSVVPQSAANHVASHANLVAKISAARNQSLHVGVN